MMRHGDWMVHGHYDLEAIIRQHNKDNPGDQIEYSNASDEPHGVQRLEFSSEAARDRAVEFFSTHPDYDFNITSGGKDYLNVNHEHFSGHDNQREAEAMLHDLEMDPNFVAKAVSVRRDIGTDYQQPIHALSAIDKLIEGMQQSSFYRDQPGSAQKQMQNDLRELGYRYLLSSAARSKYNMRKYTRGADENLLKNVQTYLHNTSYTMAQNEMLGDLHRAVGAFDDYVKSREWVKDPETGQPLEENRRYAVTRSQLQQEVHRRLAMRPEAHNSTALDKFTNVAIRLANVAKLGSPSYHFMNGLEPGALAVPHLDGDFEGGHATKYMRAAYAMFGGEFGRTMKNDFMKVLKAGIGGDPELTDQLKTIGDRIDASGAKDADDLKRMVDFMHETQYLQRDAGLDIARHYDASQNWLGRLLDYTDSLQRAVGNGVEAQNRVTTAVAAYRMARELGKMDHDQALRYAQRTLEKTAGLYTWYNKPPLMNMKNPLGRAAAQFHNYALRVSQNYSLMTAGAYHYLKKDAATPEEHERNRLLARQLLRSIAVQGLVSGLYGSFFWQAPTYALNATQLVTGFNSDDLEHWIRDGMADVIGKDLTEFLTRGGLRVLGHDFAGGLGERMSMSNVWTFGTLGEKPDDWFRALGHIVGGASAGTLADIAVGGADIFKGALAVADGRTSQGIEQILRGGRTAAPVKLFGDTMNVVANSIYGEHAPGGAVRAEPNAAQMASNLLGMRTGAQVERGEATGVFKRAEEKYQAQTTELKRAFAMARSGEERDRINELRRRFNTGVLPEQRISYEEMLKYARQYYKKQAEGPSTMGLQVGRKMRPVFERLPEVYSYQ